MGFRKLLHRRRIRRCMFDTFGRNHPAGTLVTPVTVGRVADLPPA